VDEHVGDLECLLAAVGLRDEHVVDLDPELARVADVEGVLVDDYTTLVWLPLCREVAKLQVSLPKPRRVSLAKVANSHEAASERVTPRVTPAFSKRLEVSQEPVLPQELATAILRGGRDLNARPPAESAGVEEHSTADIPHLRVVSDAAEELEGNGGHSGCHSVTRVPDQRPADWVAVALEQALGEWRETRDARALRAVLEQLFTVLE
jgi:hypothetical protein